MSFANTSVTDILATTIENRSKTVADNVTNNNALLDRLKRKEILNLFLVVTKSLKSFHSLKTEMQVGIQDMIFCLLMLLT